MAVFYQYFVLLETGTGLELFDEHVKSDHHHPSPDLSHHMKNVYFLKDYCLLFFIQLYLEQ